MPVDLVCRVLKPEDQDQTQAAGCLKIEGSRVRLQDPKSKAGSGPDFLLPGVSIIEDAVDKETDDDLNMRLGGWAGEALRGEHVTMITYGETHCGKTFVLEDAFIKTVNALLTGASDQHTFTISMVQVYQDECYDLLGIAKEASPRILSPAKRREAWRVKAFSEVSRPFSDTATFEMLVEKRVKLLKIFHEGLRTHESRSHSVLRVNVSLAGQPVSCLTFIEMAGSESSAEQKAVAFSPSASGQASSEKKQVVALERKAIYSSFLSLISVMDAIATRKLVPYRDSKVTSFLQHHSQVTSPRPGSKRPFVGRLTMVVCVEDVASDIREIEASLKFLANLVPKVEARPKSTRSHQRMSSFVPSSPAASSIGGRTYSDTGTALPLEREVHFGSPNSPDTELNGTIRHPDSPYTIDTVGTEHSAFSSPNLTRIMSPQKSPRQQLQVHFDVASQLASDLNSAELSGYKEQLLQQKSLVKRHEDSDSLLKLVLQREISKAQGLEEELQQERMVNLKLTTQQEDLSKLKEQHAELQTKHAKLLEGNAGLESALKMTYKNAEGIMDGLPLSLVKSLEVKEAENADVKEENAELKRQLSLKETEMVELELSHTQMQLQISTRRDQANPITSRSNSFSSQKYSLSPTPATRVILTPPSTEHPTLDLPDTSLPKPEFDSSWETSMHVGSTADNDGDVGGVPAVTFDIRHLSLTNFQRT